jgi:hypothetical protein
MLGLEAVGSFRSTFESRGYFYAETNLEQEVEQINSANEIFGCLRSSRVSSSVCSWCDRSVSWFVAVSYTYANYHTDIQNNGHRCPARRGARIPADQRVSTRGGEESNTCSMTG